MNQINDSQFARNDIFKRQKKKATNRKKFYTLVKTLLQTKFEANLKVIHNCPALAEKWDFDSKNVEC